MPRLKNKVCPICGRISDQAPCRSCLQKASWKGNDARRQQMSEQTRAAWSDPEHKKKRAKKIGEGRTAAASARNKDRPHNCEICGKEVTLGYTRCHSCASKALMARERENKEGKVCSVCGKLSGRKVCWTCAGKKFSETWEKKRKEGKQVVCSVCGKLGYKDPCYSCTNSESIKKAAESARHVYDAKTKVCSICGELSYKDPCQRCSLIICGFHERQKERLSDPDWYRKFSDSVKRSYNTHPGLREKRAETAARTRIEHPTSIERKVEEVLQALGLWFIREFRIKNRVYDFYLPDFNMLIEADGTYWHSRPESIENDSYKNSLAESMGYRLVRLTEEQINSEDFENLAPMYILPPH